MKPFKKGDKVKAFGLNGVVTEVMSYLMSYGDDPVRVKFESGVFYTFTKCGKLETYHKLPCLKHRKFKKSKVPHALWVNVDTDGNTYTYKEKEKADLYRESSTNGYIGTFKYVKAKNQG